jgi:hypothetical protein
MYHPRANTQPDGCRMRRREGATREVKHGRKKLTRLDWAILTSESGETGVASAP